ncbi:MAG: hypothetical protein LBV51_03060 [Acholeplasmatales bacterium]|jgi:nitrogen regulatory protein PII|nr:hypothetical protein [Acholeplasmatales bacterium]
MDLVNKVVFVVVNAGFTDEALDIIREAGATGATIISGRGSTKDAVNLLGISIEPEKEIIVSLASEATAKNIVSLIQQEVGAKTNANGVCFIMPVEKTTFINKIEAVKE